MLNEGSLRDPIGTLLSTRSWLSSFRPPFPSPRRVLALAVARPAPRAGGCVLDIERQRESSTDNEQ